MEVFVFKGKIKEATKIHQFRRKLHRALRRTLRSAMPQARHDGPRLSKADLAASLFMAPQPVPVDPRGRRGSRRRPLAYAGQARGQDIFRVR